MRRYRTRVSRAAGWWSNRVQAISGAIGEARSGRFASLGTVAGAPLSSRGLGRRPLMAETRVRIPVAVLPKGPDHAGLFSGRGQANQRARTLVGRSEEHTSELQSLRH